MEGAQTFNIPLNSPLDVHQSDMLVPANQPTLLHNRQKFQGKVLPTSLRYEHDGWAAGWDVYQFKFNEAFVPTTPDDFLIKRYLLNADNAQYILSITTKNDKEVAQIYYNHKSRLVNAAESNIIEVENGESEITGLFNDVPFTIRLNATEILSIDSALDLSAEFVTDKNGISVITVRDNTHKFVVDINDFIRGSAVINTEDEHVAAYAGFKNGIHTWKSV